MLNLCQTINYEYHKPINFDEKNPQFDIFKAESSENCLGAETKIVKNVRIATNSVIFNYFKVWRDNCINNIAYQRYSSGYKFFLKFIFPKFNFSKKRFILISDEWTSNYYHWHIIALVRLLILKEQGLLENSLLFLPKKYRRYQFALPSLEKIGVKKNQIVFLPRKSNIKVDELAYCMAYQQNPLAFNELRRVLTSNIKNKSDLGDKVYISRQGQVLRFVENEEEVVALLQKYGFKKIIMEHLDYEEQIAICSKIKYLVSPHGAGLTNIIFMPENSMILEMATKPYAEKPVTDYYKLADMLNIKYYYQECAIGPKSPVQDFHQGSLVVDLEKLEENLKLMLKK